MARSEKDAKLLFDVSMLPQLVFDALDSADFEVQKAEAPDNEGQWYVVPFNVRRRPPLGEVYTVCDFSEILADFGTKVRIVELGTATVDTVRVRVTKFIEQDSPREQSSVTGLGSSGVTTVKGIPEEAVKFFYAALRNVNTDLPEYSKLTPVKRRVLASQMNTIYMTMNM